MNKTSNFLVLGIKKTISPTRRPTSTKSNLSNQFQPNLATNFNKETKI